MTKDKKNGFREISLHEYFNRQRIGLIETCYLLNSLKKISPHFENSNFLEELINSSSYTNARTALALLLLSCDDEYLSDDAKLLSKAHQANNALNGLSGLIGRARIEHPVADMLNHLISRCHDFFVLEPQDRF